ncbi:MAG: hypothetical protein JWO61_8 [Candidatus Saccharibacteria bacterium]|nr:hypothetical protein [Candidatus Saccharibacteria bacterium]
MVLRKIVKALTRIAKILGYAGILYIEVSFVIREVRNALKPFRKED